MIRTEKEYQEMVQRLEQDREYIKLQKEKLQELGLAEEEVNRAMEPALSFHEQLKEEVEYYEKIKRGDFNALINLQGLGKLLIGIRISLGISQSELARRLNVSEAQVSKDERNEYHGISVEKAQRILDALGVTVMTKVEHLPLKTAV
ncbi:MAG: helix-turn-helix domain-containing protein [Bacillota bacterium]|jgi:DNA-binding XRE family transcriptional regulator